jgi:hypothetical protein
MKMNCRYGVLPEYLASILAQSLFLLIQSILFSVPVYFLSGLKPTLDACFSFVFGIYLLMEISAAFAHLLVAGFRSASLITILFSSSFAVLMLMSGFLCPSDAIPTLWKPMFDLNFFRFIFFFIAGTQMEQDGLAGELLRTFSIEPSKRFVYLNISFVFLFCFRTITYIALKFIRHIDR